MFTNPPGKPATERLDRGFTLIEVVVALTILGMITGTLFAIIQGAVRGASDIELVQRENDSVNRLFELLRKTFATLPSSATLRLRQVGQTMSEVQELTIVGAPGSLGFGIKPISYSDTVLALRPDLLGRTDENELLLGSFSISRDDLIPKTDDNRMALGQELDGVLAQDEQGRNWMPLLPDVVALKWRFYRVSNQTWYEEWSRTSWPDLIEIQLQMKDRIHPMRMVFGVPTLELAAGRPTVTPAAGATTTTTPAAPGGTGAGGAPAGGTPQGGAGGATPNPGGNR